MSELARVGDDFRDMMRKIAGLRSGHFKEFAQTWNAFKHYCLYWKAMELRITHDELKEYDPMESFMKLCIMDALHFVCCKVQERWQRRREWFPTMLRGLPPAITVGELFFRLRSNQWRRTTDCLDNY